MSKIENKDKKPRNIWTLMFAQMLALETKDYDLEIDYEHELFRNPMRIDVVVVKKPENVVIKNSALKFFKNYNVIEFKGPVDNLNVAKYNKVMAYFYAYLAGKKLSFDDVAITLVSIKKPLELLEYLEKERKYKIIPAKESGIYYIKADNLPATQLIVSKEAKVKDLAWIKALRNDLTVEEGLEITKLFGEGEDVIQSLILANENLLKEMENMQVKDPEIRRILERVSGKTFVGERQQGMRERDETIARNMKAEGADLHFIARVTGLSFDEVLNV
jgi:hypothetical protein